MVQRINLYYVYYRFFLEEARISAVLTKYCKEWVKISSVGYNYKEYKCYTNNAGGLETAVGETGGYLKIDREVGFIDGSPSDGVFDQTLIMGAKRLILDDIDILSGFRPGTGFIFRKITGKDGGIDHNISIAFGNNQKISHPVMYTIDSTQVEMVVATDVGITDSSTVDEYEMFVDVGISPNPLNLDATDHLTLTDPEHMLDCDLDTYAKLECATGDPDGRIVLASASVFTNVAIKLTSYAYGTHGSAFARVYHSMDGSTWSHFGTGASGVTDTYTFTATGIEAKYVQVVVDKYGSGNAGRVDVFEVIAT